MKTKIDVSVQTVIYTQFCLFVLFTFVVYRSFTKMPVKGVYLTADCYSVCLAHALTTEKEEIMGLLIGEVC